LEFVLSFNLLDRPDVPDHLTKSTHPPSLARGLSGASYGGRACPTRPTWPTRPTRPTRLRSRASRPTRRATASKPDPPDPL